MEENIENEKLASPPDMTEAEALAKIEAAYQRRPQETARQPPGRANDAPPMNGRKHGNWKEEESIRYRAQNPNKEEWDDTGFHQNEEHQRTSEKEKVRLGSELQREMVVQKEIELAEIHNPPATQWGANSSLLEDCEVLNKEKLIKEVIDEDSSIQEAVFDLTVKKEFDRKAKAREKRKKSPTRRRMYNFSAAISVNTSPSNLDMTVAAFEPEWRDGLWDIFTHGIFHPLPLLSLWAPICKSMSNEDWKDFNSHLIYAH